MKTTTKTDLTPASEQLFISLANDAGNWNGCPMIDVTPANRGNLTQIKKAGLLTTFKDEGIIWVDFTDAGVEYAAARGITIKAPM